MKILIVSNGDAEKKSTWSGVPNRVVCALRDFGHEVVCCDLSVARSIRPIRIFFNRVIRRLVYPWRWVPFETTRLGIWLTNCWLRKQVKSVGSVDAVIAFSFCVDANGVEAPVVLVHDWTNGYMQQMFHERPMSAAEKQGDAHQFAAMRSAAKVVVLYPKSAEYIRENVGETVCFYGNPINSEPPGDIDVNIEGGVVSKHILVIGGATYQENVEYVIQAADHLADKDVVVDVIGRTSAATIPQNVQVNFFGYLNKDISEQKLQYGSLIRNARCLVNIRRGWGGGSSIAEALYNGLPVVSGSYPDIQGLYGDEGKACLYCTPGSVDELTGKLQTMLSMSVEEYRAMCRHASDMTKDDTYANYVAKVLEGIC